MPVKKELVNLSIVKFIKKEQRN